MFPLHLIPLTVSASFATAVRQECQQGKTLISPSKDYLAICENLSCPREHRERKNQDLL